MTRTRWLQLALGAAIFGFLLWQLDLDGAREALRDADPLALAAALLLNVPIVALFGVRSQLVLHRLGHRLPFSLVLPIALVGNVAGALTPASSGEVLRAGALRVHADVSTRDAVALVFYERGISLYLLAVGTLAGVAWLALPLAGAIGVSVVAVFATALPLLAPRLLRRLPAPDGEPGSTLGRVIASLRGSADRLSLLLDDARLLAQWSVLTLCVFAVLALQYWLLARSLSGAISINEAWVALGLSQLAAIISLIPLGLGVADSSLAALLERFGMTLEQGAAVALLARATSTLPLIIAAFACYVWLVRRAPNASDRSATPADALAPPTAKNAAP